jgi:hypothetical protein
MEFRDFGHATIAPICNWIFETLLVDGKFKGLSNEGMLSSTAIAVEFAQNCPKLSNFVKICLKTISLRNFEIPPKMEILIFFQKNTLNVEDTPKACAHYLDFQYNNVLYAFFIVQKRHLYVNFNIPHCGK